MGSKTFKGFGAGLLTGAVIGGVIALLYAPQPGKKTRQQIKDKATEIIDEVDEVVDTINKETGTVMDRVTEVMDDIVDTVK